MRWARPTRPAPSGTHYHYTMAGQLPPFLIVVALSAGAGLLITGDRWPFGLVALLVALLLSIGGATTISDALNKSHHDPQRPR